MIVLDILFKICFAPFQKLNNGRIAAIIWLMQIIGFTGIGLFNILFFVLGVNLSSIEIAIIGALITIVVYFLFVKIYVKKNREVGNIKFPFLMGVLIFILTGVRENFKVD